MKQFAALFIVCLLAGCASIAAPLSETRHFSGIYINGWEAQIFVENGRENEQRIGLR